MLVARCLLQVSDPRVLSWKLDRMHKQQVNATAEILRNMIRWDGANQDLSKAVHDIGLQMTSLSIGGTVAGHPADSARAILDEESRSTLTTSQIEGINAFSKIVGGLNVRFR